MATISAFGGSPRRNRNHINPALIQQTTTSILSTTISQPNQIGLLISSSTPTSSKQYNSHRHRASNSNNGPISSPLMDMSHKTQLHSISRHNKRKSAVELLAETKSYYIKSEHPTFTYRRNIITSPTLCTTSLDERQHFPSSRRCLSTSSDILQNKLRTLLNTSTENKRFSMSATPSEMSSNYDVSQKLNKQLTATSDPNSDISVFFPSSFISPQSIPPANHLSDEDIYAQELLADNYQTISPPAEYAEENYQTLYSHRSHQIVETSDDDEIEYSKSLPDLHSQLCRHSPHSEALSCCSRGNRSNKSGSSFNNRDSGGSSGHYTHRSEPGCNLNIPKTHDFRRDSGSSTQHSSGNSYKNGIPAPRYDCIECRAEIQNDANCLLHFTTLEVPEAFQDNYSSTASAGQSTAIEKAQRYHDIEMNIARYKHSRNIDSDTVLPHTQQEIKLSPQLGTFRRQRGIRLKQRSRYLSPSDRNCRSEDDRRPILRSKSDIGDRSYYWKRSSSAAAYRGDVKSKISQAAFISDEKNCRFEKPSPRKSTSDSRLSTLERFFENLGITSHYSNNTVVDGTNDDESIHSSPVFFSDKSTVDSNRLPDSTETNSQNLQLYRPIEHTSIVERNARIIKWLCNCRKYRELS